MDNPSPGKYLELFLKGIGMGAADVVPGVSGGTIAFITGIYEELVNSLRSFDIEALRLIFKGRVAEFWRRINGTFLLVLFSGILTSVFSLARLMEFLLSSYPTMVWSFFFGLVLISGISVLRRIRVWDITRVASLVSGTVIMVIITRFSPAETSEAYWFIYLSGAIAICAMILPGVSGAFILLILGKYQFILQAVGSFDLPVIALFGAGVVTGLLSFANLLSWLLRNFHDLTVALLSGFIIGSLNKIWPWKETLSSAVDSHGELIPLVQRNILPGKFTELNGSESLLIPAIFLFFTGIAVVLLFEWIAKRRS